jgi:hypothetical protein
MIKNRKNQTTQDLEKELIEKVNNTFLTNTENTTENVDNNKTPCNENIGYANAYTSSIDWEKFKFKSAFLIPKKLLELLYEEYPYMLGNSVNDVPYDESVLCKVAEYYNYLISDENNVKDNFKALKKNFKLKEAIANFIIQSITQKLEGHNEQIKDDDLKKLEKHIEKLIFEKTEEIKEQCNEVVKLEPSNEIIKVETEQKTYEMVNHPTHYNNYDKEVIEMMINIWGPEETAIFCKLNAFKYRMRMGTKPNNDIKQDLNKEKWYLKKFHELKK